MTEKSAVSRKTLLFVVNNPSFFISHRLPVGLAAMSAGYEVHVASGTGEASINQLIDMGFVHHLLPLSRSGKNPLSELRLMRALYRLFKQIKPDVLHLVTIKPVLYGGITARLARVRSVVYAISGLGAVYIAKGYKAHLLRTVVALLYRLALGHKNKVVIFQNHDDKDLISRIAHLQETDMCLIKGSGVDLNAYPAMPEPAGKPVVVIACRLLKDKGLGEFIEAISILNARDIKATYWIVGDIDSGNPASFTEDDLQKWSKIKNLELLGFSSDIAHVYAQSNIVCLPSYREGFPKSLIEAAACGRAIVTTDVPGCRDAIIVDKTGILVPAKDSAALAYALERLIVSPQERNEMGVNGRTFAEKEFAIEKIVNQHLAIYRQLESFD